MQAQGVKVKRRLFAIHNKYQKKIISLVFFASFVPVMIAILLVFLLIFSILKAEISNAEAITYVILPAALTSAAGIAIIVPIAILIILWWAYKVSNRLVGPLGRLGKELDRRIQDNSRDHITFRKGDDLCDLADKINVLLDRMK